jgi:HK97 family phage prohead protease
MQDYSTRDIGEWDLLNERQQEQAEDQSNIALEFGQWNQSIDADGAHYAPAANNPFKADGIICDNCIFYNSNAQQCQIVEGMIEPEGICKLWVIPESDLGIVEDMQEPIADMNARWKSVTLNLRSKEGQSMETKVERRVNNVEFDIRAAEASSNGMSFTGYAAVFNSPSEPLPFTEVIKEGAFKRSLKARNEIKLFMNHNTDVVLGSTRAGTLQLTEDSRGLLAQAQLPDTQAGRDLSVLMKRGDVSSMSFGFSVPPKGDTWSQDGNTRELHQIRLHEVSIVTGFPAYEATTASVRSLDILAQRTAVDVDALSDAILKLEAGETLESEHADLITEVVSKLRAQDVNQNHLLEIKRKQLDLMLKAF